MNNNKPTLENMRPFYCTDTWFLALKETTEKNNILHNLKFNEASLPHVIEIKNTPLARVKKLKSLSNYYTPIFELPNFSYQDSCKLYNHKVTSFSVLDLSPLTEENTVELSKHLEKLGFWVCIYEKNKNWYQENITDSEDYWQSRPSILINTLARKKRRAEKDPNYELTIYSEHNITLLQQYLKDYHRVYNNSWKTKEAYPEFINAIACHESTRGNLRLGIVYQSSMPVAAQIWFKFDKTAYIFKLAYDEKFKKEGYGNLLTQALVNFCIQHDGVNTIDFLTGNDPYKKDWMDSCRPLYGLLALNKRTAYGLIMIIWLKIKSTLKHWLKKGID